MKLNFTIKEFETKKIFREKPPDKKRRRDFGATV